MDKEIWNTLVAMTGIIVMGILLSIGMGGRKTTQVVIGEVYGCSGRACYFDDGSGDPMQIVLDEWYPPGEYQVTFSNSAGAFMVMRIDSIESLKRVKYLGEIQKVRFFRFEGDDESTVLADVLFEGRSDTVEADRKCRKGQHLWRQGGKRYCTKTPNPEE